MVIFASILFRRAAIDGFLSKKSIKFGKVFFSMILKRVSFYKEKQTDNAEGSLGFLSFFLYDFRQPKFLLGQF